jgi:membrane fusion protein, multidrug efflux system
MVEKQNAYSDKSTRIQAGLKAGEAVSVEQGTKSLQRDPSSTLVPPADHLPRRKRMLLMGVLAALVLAAIGIFGVPWIQLTLNTVSTDDAYVNGHVTFVAARVSGQVTRVLVDDNNRVRKGDLLVQLDKEPYQDAVAVKRAAVDTAKADLPQGGPQLFLKARKPHIYWRFD